MSAVTMCERLNIRSPKDTELLKKAKDEVYLKGFYEGVMLVGECAGMKVWTIIISSPCDPSHSGLRLCYYRSWTQSPSSASL